MSVFVFRLTNITVYKPIKRNQKNGEMCELSQANIDVYEMRLFNVRDLTVDLLHIYKWVTQSQKFIKSKFKRKLRKIYIQIEIHLTFLNYNEWNWRVVTKFIGLACINPTFLSIRIRNKKSVKLHEKKSIYNGWSWWTIWAQILIRFIRRTWIWTYITFWHKSHFIFYGNVGNMSRMVLHMNAYTPKRKPVAVLFGKIG